MAILTDCTTSPTLRVLVVEDDPDIRDVLAYTLEREGFEVLGVSDGERALEVMRATRPDLVLLDLLMPGLDGRGVARVMMGESALSRIPVVSMSASPEEVAPSLARVHVQKPFTIAAIVDAIRHALSRTELAVDH